MTDWRTILEAAAKLPVDSEAWLPVMEQLGLDLCYQPAVRIVLAEGRWRSAKNPRAYLRTAATREAVRLGLTEETGAVPVSQRRILAEQGGAAQFRASLETANPGGDELDELLERIPADLKQDAVGLSEIDWEEVACRAVERQEMAEAVAEVLYSRWEGESREKMFSYAETAEERRSLQAAWRWVDRNWQIRIAPVLRGERK